MISVSEKLPGSDGIVLGYNIHTDCYAICHLAEDTEAKWIDHATSLETTITHWAELPLLIDAEGYKIKKAKDAIHHTLTAICDDPRKFYLMGYGTGSYDKLTDAHATLWEVDVEKVRKQAKPRNEEAYRAYCKKWRVKDEYNINKSVACTSASRRAH